MSDGLRHSTRKKDSDLPRGIVRLGRAYGIRFTCGAGHVHEEKVGPVKGDAIRAHAARRARVYAEAGWCPAVERRQARQLARAAQARRMTVLHYAEKDYLPWAKLHHRGWRTEESRIAAMTAAFGDAMLDSLTTAEVERFLDGLLVERSQSTRNRYRTLFHAMLNRARRHGRLPLNPVQGIGKFKEPEGRTLYLMPEDEMAVREALRLDLRPLFTFSVHTGLRWSE